MRWMSPSRWVAGCEAGKMTRPLLAGGVARVVLGTVAVRDPGLVDAWPANFPTGSSSVSITARGGADVAVAGWEGDGGVTPGRGVERV
jgi:phosphoribosylformimino-5-aminoimidazole carboxamide ribonucleotide (ProFAR) isomerase